MRPFTFLIPMLTCASAGALGMACSGASDTGLFAGGDAPPSTTDSADASGTHTGQSDSGSGSAQDASQPPLDASTGGGQGGDAASPDSAVGIDAAPAVDAAPPPPPPPEGVYCGKASGKETYCTDGDTCCVSTLGSKCSTGQGNNFCTGTELECDDQTDCSDGDVCCGTLIGNRYQSVRCQSSCGQPGNGYSYRFCDPHAAVDECAAEGTTCTASQTLVGYFICN